MLVCRDTPAHGSRYVHALPEPEHAASAARRLARALTDPVVRARSPSTGLEVDGMLRRDACVVLATVSVFCGATTLEAIRDGHRLLRKPSLMNPTREESIGVVSTGMFSEGSATPALPLWVTLSTKQGSASKTFGYVTDAQTGQRLESFDSFDVFVKGNPSLIPRPKGLSNIGFGLHNWAHVPDDGGELMQLCHAISSEVAFRYALVLDGRLTEVAMILRSASGRRWRDCRHRLSRLTSG